VAPSGGISSEFLILSSVPFRISGLSPALNSQEVEGDIGDDLLFKSTWVGGCVKSVLLCGSSKFLVGSNTIFEGLRERISEGLGLSRDPGNI